jgi:hypothetical protein
MGISLTRSSLGSEMVTTRTTWRADEGIRRRGRDHDTRIVCRELPGDVVPMRARRASRGVLPEHIPHGGLTGRRHPLRLYPVVGTAGTAGTTGRRWPLAPARGPGRRNVLHDRSLTSAISRAATRAGGAAQRCAAPGECARCLRLSN